MFNQIILIVVIIMAIRSEPNSTQKLTLRLSQHGDIGDKVGHFVKSDALLQNNRPQRISIIFSMFRGNKNHMFI